MKSLHYSILMHFLQYIQKLNRMSCHNGHCVPFFFSVSISHQENLLEMHWEMWRMSTDRLKGLGAVLLR